LADINFDGVDPTLNTVPPHAPVKQVVLQRLATQAGEALSSGAETMGGFGL